MSDKHPLIIRPEVKIETIEGVIEEILPAVIDKVLKHGSGAFAGPHETYGIIAEEYQNELLSALKANDPKAFSTELMDIIVAAVFGIASMRILDCI